MAVRSILLATRNSGKVREIKLAFTDLPVELISLDEFDDLPEPDETGDTFAANARQKAMYYHGATRLWALAEDSGLVVDALDGAPGVRSARYAAQNCPSNAHRDAIDSENNRRLLAELENVPDADRTARFVSHLSMAGDGQILLEATGRVEGRIARTPRGENGFGYDPLFFVPSLGCTTAELTTSQKNRISHRGKAIRQFARRLEEFLADRGEAG